MPHAIVVVNYGSAHLVWENLRALESREDRTVVVVDNFTTQAERDTLRSHAREGGWVVVASETNIGFGAAMNLGVREAESRGAEAVLLLNPDARIDEESILELAGAATDRTIASPRVLRPDGSVWFDGMVVDLDRGDMRRATHARGGEAFWLTGACLWVPLAVWRELDGFDEDYFLYWEDVDLSVRAARMGIALEVVESATAVHEVGGTQQARTREKSPVYYFYNVRNRLLFARKNLDRATARRWRLTSVSAAYRILLRGGRRQFLRPGGSILPAVRGLIAGLRGR